MVVTAILNNHLLRVISFLFFHLSGEDDESEGGCRIPSKECKRFLRWALDGRTVALPEAVRKMTSLPAGQFGLHDRGVIAEGRKADLVVFDAARLRDRADYGDPHQLSEGITHLVVNGVVTIRDGTLTGTRGGRLV